MPATSARTRAIAAYVKHYPDVKLYKDKLIVSKARSKKRITISFGGEATKLSWSYKDGTLKRI